MDRSNQFKIVVCAFIFIICCVIQICPASAIESTFSTQAEVLIDRLEPLPITGSRRIFDKYYAIISKELDMGNLYVTQLQEIKVLLDKAVFESIDVLTLFTHPGLQQKKVLVIEKDILRYIDRHYDLHALFMLSCSSISNGGIVQMDFLIVGQGKLIVGYNKNAQIKHPDYAFVTGVYGYQKIFIMSAGTDEQGNPGLFGIQGVSGINEEFKPMSGPLNSAIQSLSIICDSSGDKRILVQYQLFGRGRKVVKRIPIEIRER